MNNSAQPTGFDVSALQAGDRREFARLVDVYSGPIYRLVLKMLDHPQDAEDVLQDTFLKAYHHLPAFENRSSLSTWLYRIAVNEALMRIRKHEPFQVSIDEPAETDEDAIEPRELADWRALPEEMLLSTEMRQVLDKAIERLSLTLRTVFILRDIQDLSVRETAEALNLTENTVKTRLLRARLRLRELLSGYVSRRLMEK
jgi:RNA polymerase sigma-70 factor (ECF subfamily)